MDPTLDPLTFHDIAIETLNDLEGQGIAWCSNSGRSFRNQQEIVERATARGLKHKPTALLCSEFLIYPKRNGSYASSEPWNTTFLQTMKQLQNEITSLIENKYAHWIHEYEFQTYFTDEYTAFNVPQIHERPARMEQSIRAALSDRPDILITRNGGWVSVLPTGTGKGNLLTEYINNSPYTADDILAIGDHLNDITMLDGRIVRHVGCPGDAHEMIKRLVTMANGFVATASGPQGTVEIIRNAIKSS